MAAITQSTLADLLAPTLGAAQAKTVVAQAVLRSGMDPTALEQRECEQLLATLGKEPGLVGVVARFARARLPFLFTAGDPRASRPDPRAAVALGASSETAAGRHRGGERHGARQRPSGEYRRYERRRRTSKPSVELERFVELFADGMDASDAERLVREGMRDAGLSRNVAFTATEADAVLDAIERRGGRYSTDALLVRTRLRGVFGR